MPSYELLAVFPGTLSEVEVGPLAEALKETIEKIGASEVAAHDLGKIRLAYPMKHIRYGYFRIYFFQAEPSAASEIQQKAQLVSNILRAVIRKYDPKKQNKKLPILSEVALDSIEEPRREPPPADEALQAQFVASTPAPAPVVEGERKTEAIALEDIDKKLDEPLGSDLAKV